MNFPADIRYTSEHEWIRVEGDEAYVGITDYAQSELGEIVFVDVPTLGETVGQGEVFGSIEAVINGALDAQPELVNNDPYGEGWFIRISVKDAAELDKLMDATAYQAIL